MKKEEGGEVISEFEEEADPNEDEIPDDSGVQSQMEGYFLKTKDNHLTEKKGHNTMHDGI